MERDLGTRILLVDGSADVVRAKGEPVDWRIGQPQPLIPEGKLLIHISTGVGIPATAIDVTHPFDFRRFLPNTQQLYSRVFGGLYLVAWKEVDYLRPDVEHVG